MCSPTTSTMDKEDDDPRGAGQLVIVSDERCKRAIPRQQLHRQTSTPSESSSMVVCCQESSDDHERRSATESVEQHDSQDSISGKFRLHNHESLETLISRHRRTISEPPVPGLTIHDVNCNLERRCLASR
jgi:hypothetical protein